MCQFKAINILGEIPAYFVFKVRLFDTYFLPFAVLLK
jgi:hypothetical protein